MIAGTLMCTSPAATVMASDATETVQEIITDNEIDSLVSDPDKVVDIIMYAKDKVAEQDISDEQIREIIQAGEETAGVTLTEEDENKLINIVKEEFSKYGKTEADFETRSWRELLGQEDFLWDQV